MTTEPAPANAASADTLRKLGAQLDAVEAELKRLGWWSAQPPDLLAEVAAGKLKSYLDAPSFELWLQCVFLPNARNRVAEADLPKTSSVGEMARRQYDYHCVVPEAETLLKLLQDFDALIESRHQPPPAPQMPPQMAEMFAQSRGLLLHWLDLAEDQLKRHGWWDGDSGEPGSAFGAWMRDTFAPAARASIRQGIVPPAADLMGETGRRLAAEGLTLPEEMEPVLRNFDEGVAMYHSTWELCGLPPAVAARDAPATPPEYRGDLANRPSHPAPRERLPLAPPEPEGYEILREDARLLLGNILDCIGMELEDLPPELPPPAGGAEPVEEWLAEEFLPDVREWLEKDQVPEGSEVAVSAEQEFKTRGVVKRAAKLLENLQSFDAQVAAYHQMSLTLPKETAGSRLAAAWTLIMASPVLENPVAPEPDALRMQMLVLLNRVEAELHLLGWWCAAPRLMPEPFQDIEYPRGLKEVQVPRFESWLLASWLPRMRERAQAGAMPDKCRVHDDAIRSLNGECLGREKYDECRRLIECFDHLESLMLEAWPAAMQRQAKAGRRRGLTPPSKRRASKESGEIQEYRDDATEALRLISYELKSLGWWGCDADAVRKSLTNPYAAPPPFEHWLEVVFLPEARVRLKDGRLLEQRRVNDYVAWECRHTGHSKAAQELLRHLERLDHCSALVNKAILEMWSDG